MAETQNTGRDTAEDAFRQLSLALHDQLMRRHADLRGTDINSLAASMARIAPKASNTSAMADAVGPFYDTAGLESWLGVSRQTLSKRVQARKLLGCRSGDKPPRLVYPTWQFTEEGKLLPGLEETLAILAQGTGDAWSWALWLVGAVPDELDGMSAARWLTEGRDKEPVLTLARQDAAVWAA